MSVNTLATLSNHIRPRRGLVFGVLIFSALLSFELFNFSTTEFALTDLLGELSFAGIYWSTILAIAFCGIDFAGIARLFTPEQGSEEPSEVWYLFGAWLLAATMNAMLTWWGVSIALLNHVTLGNALIDHATLLKAVPVFVAVMVWLSRVLIIGTFSLAGERLFSQAARRQRPALRSQSAPRRTFPAPQRNRPRPAPAAQAFRPSPKPEPAPEQPEHPFARPEPTYHPVALGARPAQRPAQPPLRKQ